MELGAKKCPICGEALDSRAGLERLIRDSWTWTSERKPLTEWTDPRDPYQLVSQVLWETLQLAEAMLQCLLDSFPVAAGAMVRCMFDRARASQTMTREGTEQWLVESARERKRYLEGYAERFPEQKEAVAPYLDMVEAYLWEHRQQPTGQRRGGKPDWQMSWYEPYSKFSEYVHFSLRTFEQVSSQSEKEAN